MSDTHPPLEPAAAQHAIEKNLVATWSRLGRWPKGELHDSDGVLRYHTPIAHAPYSGVLRTHWENGGDIDAKVRSTLDIFAERKRGMVWWVTPMTQPADLETSLVRQGLTLTAELAGMAGRLGEVDTSFEPEKGVEIREVENLDDLKTYVTLTARRWHVDRDIELLHDFNRWIGVGRELPIRRWVAYVDGKPMGKAVISVADGVAGLYGVSTEPESWGMGIGTGVTLVALEAARKAGCELGILHSTEMAVGLYRRLGFKEFCPLKVYSPAMMSPV